MPFTPFIGISIIFHLGVIISRKLFHWGSKSANLQMPAGSFSRLGNLAIVPMIFLAMSAIGATLVFASVNSRYSTISAVRTYAPGIISRLESGFMGKNTFSVISYPAPELNKPATGFNVAAASALELTPAVLAPVDCGKTFSELSYQYQFSVTNFLNSINQKYTLEMRAALAVEAGMDINNYQGTTEQNLLLLKQAMLDTGHLPALCATQRGITINK